MAKIRIEQDQVIKSVGEGEAELVEELDRSQGDLINFHGSFENISKIQPVLLGTGRISSEGQLVMPHFGYTLYDLEGQGLNKNVGRNLLYPFASLSVTLAYLHNEKRIIYGDLHPGQIMSRGFSPKTPYHLIDFGASRIFEPSSKQHKNLPENGSNIIFNELFAAPELLITCTNPDDKRLDLGKSVNYLASQVRSTYTFHEYPEKTTAELVKMVSVINDMKRTRRLPAEELPDLLLSYIKNPISPKLDVYSYSYLVARYLTLSTTVDILTPSLKKALRRGMSMDPNERPDMIEIARKWDNYLYQLWNS